MLAICIEKIVVGNFMWTVPQWFSLPFWEIEKACGKTRILSVRDFWKVSKDLPCGNASDCDWELPITLAQVSWKGTQLQMWHILRDQEGRRRKATQGRFVIFSTLCFQKRWWKRYTTYPNNWKSERNGNSRLCQPVGRNSTFSFQTKWRVPHGQLFLHLEDMN